MLFYFLGGRGDKKRNNHILKRESEREKEMKIT